MGDVALTDIRYGKDDGTVLEIKQGSSDWTKLPDDVVEELQEAGSIGPASQLPGATQSDTIDDLHTRIAQLEAENDGLRQQLDDAGIEPQTAAGEPTPEELEAQRLEAERLAAQGGGGATP